jgi:hypothetical protein
MLVMQAIVVVGLVVTLPLTEQNASEYRLPSEPWQYTSRLRTPEPHVTSHGDHAGVWYM